MTANGLLWLRSVIGNELLMLVFVAARGDSADRRFAVRVVEELLFRQPCRPWIRSLLTWRHTTCCRRRLDPPTSRCLTQLACDVGWLGPSLDRPALRELSTSRPLAILDRRKPDARTSFLALMRR